MGHSNIINQTDFLSMDMHNGPGRSYKYYTGEPLFPFGFGLSYTSFTLDWSPSPPPTGHTLRVGNVAATITYTVKVTNTGSRAGDEVVLAFFKPKQIAGVSANDPEALASHHGLGPAPKKQLFAFERVHLQPGASTTLTFTVTPSDLALVGLEGHRVLVHGSVYEMQFTRGHGQELRTRVELEVDAGRHVVSRFQKWWK